jgi:hypothetical protein
LNPAQQELHTRVPENASVLTVTPDAAPAKLSLSPVWSRLTPSKRRNSMFGLEKLAASFDRMHAEVQRDFDKLMLEDHAKWSGGKYGPDSWETYYFAISQSVGWALGTFTMDEGKKLADVLRIGEGIKSKTTGGVAGDALRLLTLLPILGSGVKLGGAIARSLRLSRAARQAGQLGPMSCGPAALAVAGRASGQASSLTIAEVGKVIGKGDPNSLAFPGMYLHELRTTLPAVSLTSQEIDFAGKGVEAVAEVASRGKGPVIFGVQWWEKVGGVTRPWLPANAKPVLQAPTSAIGKALNPGGINRLRPNAALSAEGPDHWLTALRTASGQVVVADQNGIRPIADLAKTPLTLASRGFLVPDGALLPNWFKPVVPVLGNLGWLAHNFVVNMVVVDVVRFWLMDTAVQRAQRKEPRSWPGMPDGMLDALARASKATSGRSSGGKGGGRNGIPPPAAVPAPNLLSPTVFQDAQLVLSKMPPRDTREYSDLQK